MEFLSHDVIDRCIPTPSYFVDYFSGPLTSDAVALCDVELKYLPRTISWNISFRWFNFRDKKKKLRKIQRKEFDIEEKKKKANERKIREMYENEVSL